ncbi:MAG: fibronectin type III domain-containing protein [Bacteroidota bacterium]
MFAVSTALALFFLAGCSDSVTDTGNSYAPGAPGNLSAEMNGSTTALLRWEHSSSHLTEINCYELTVNGRPPVKIGKMLSSYTVSDVNSDSNYIFSLRTRGANDRLSEATTTQLIPYSNAPAPPTNLTATTISTSMIRLQWTPSVTKSDSIDGYRLSIDGKPDDSFIDSWSSPSYEMYYWDMNKVYTFSLRTVNKNGVESKPVTLVYSPSIDNPLAPAPPTNFMANSYDFNTIFFKWTASADVNKADFDSYEMGMSDGTTQEYNPVTISKTKTGIGVNGLPPGKVYTFTLRAKNAAGYLSNPQVVQWSPALRYKGIRLYETASGSYKYGINLESAEVTSLSTGGSSWDICLDTRSVNGQPSFDIGAPSMLSHNITNPRATLISEKRYENILSIDEVFDTEALANGSMRPTVARAINFTNATTGFVFFAKTIEGHYAKIFLKAAGGKVLQGIAPSRYIEMDISYQSAKDLPYALVSSGSDPSGISGSHIFFNKKSGE